MTSAALSWLPDSVLTDVRSAEPVARCLLDWSNAWLCTYRLSAPPRWEKPEGDGSSFSFGECATGRGFRLMLRENGRSLLASLMLGREIGERDLRSAGDHAVIQDITARAIDDLERMLGEVFASPRSAPLADFTNRQADQGDDIFCLPLAPGANSALLIIQASRPAVAGLAASWAGPPRKASPLDPRQAAVETQPLKLSGQIGTRRLPLAEIEQLGLGDVLLLEHEVSAPIHACIEGQRVSDTALTIIPGDTEFAFKIERPATQW